MRSQVHLDNAAEAQQRSRGAQGGRPVPQSRRSRRLGTEEPLIHSRDRKLKTPCSGQCTRRRQIDASQHRPSPLRRCIRDRESGRDFLERESPGAAHDHASLNPATARLARRGYAPDQIGVPAAAIDKSDTRTFEVLTTPSGRACRGAHPESLEVGSLAIKPVAFAFPRTAIPSRSCRVYERVISVRPIARNVPRTTVRALLVARMAAE